LGVKGKSAWLGNGILGLHIGPNPLHANLSLSMEGGGHALVGGYYRMTADGKPSPAPAPYPFETDFRVQGISMAEHPELVTVHEQHLNLSTGELITSMTFASSAPNNTFEVNATVIVFASRSLPTIAAMRVQAQYSPASAVVQLKPALEIPTKVVSADAHKPADQPMPLDPPIVDTTFEQYFKNNTPWPWQKIEALEWMVALRHAGSVEELHPSTLGVSVTVERHNCTTDANTTTCTASTNDVSGREQYGQFTYDTATAMVSSLYDATPTEASMKAALFAIPRRGFNRLRAANQASWASLWRGRVAVEGPNVTAADQLLLDAAFFYLHSAAHSSTKQGIACYGLAQWEPLAGHVFWDMDFW
jgi:trehalose/maltose hydrolase-like predicted phosphorylase